MKLCIANYDNSTSKGGSRNLVIHCNDLKWIEENFGDKKITASIGGGKINLRVDPHGHSRWGAVSKGRRQIAITHDTDLRLFGATYILSHVPAEASASHPRPTKEGFDLSKDHSVGSPQGLAP